MRLGTRFGKIAVGQNDEPADVGEFATVHRYAVVGRGVRLLRLRSRFRWSPKVRYRAWNRGMAARRSRCCASFLTRRCGLVVNKRPQQAVAELPRPRDFAPAVIPSVHGC